MDQRRSASSDVKIREAKAPELATCALVLESAWASAFPDLPRRVTPEQFREQTHGELILVATHKGDLAAFISVWTASWFVHHLFVAPEHQAHGIGGRLLRFVLALSGANSLGLKSQVENRAAIRFYDRHGFKPTGSRGSDEFGEWIEMRTQPSQAESASVVGEARRPTSGCS
jgi:GNAT superfamily N-acetyltransferase